MTKAKAPAPKKTGKRGIGPAEDSPKPKQGRLPEMDDPIIEEIEGMAEKYAGVRDRRMALTTQEVDLQAELLKIMKKHSKLVYRRNGIEAKVVAEKEKVRVRIKKDGDKE